MTDELTHFLNVDLELITRGELAALLDHWSGRVVLLRDTVDDGQRTVWLELDVEHAEVEHVLLGFLDLVGKLPDDLRKVWDACDDRCFNVGIQAGGAPHSATYTVSPRTLGRIAGVMARVAFTVYAPTSESDAHGEA